MKEKTKCAETVIAIVNYKDGRIKTKREIATKKHLFKKIIKWLGNKK